MFAFLHILLNFLQNSVCFPADPLQSGQASVFGRAVGACGTVPIICDIVAKVHILRHSRPANTVGCAGVWCNVSTDKVQDACDAELISIENKSISENVLHTVANTLQLDLDTN